MNMDMDVEHGAGRSEKIWSGIIASARMRVGQ